MDEKKACYVVEYTFDLEKHLWDWNPVTGPHAVCSTLEVAQQWVKARSEINSKNEKIERMLATRRAPRWEWIAAAFPDGEEYAWHCPTSPNEAWVISRIDFIESMP